MPVSTAKFNTADNQGAPFLSFPITTVSTRPILVADERGFTVPFSTAHQTQADALAHFTEVLARLHRQHPATKAATMVSIATPEPTAATAEASGHEQPINASHRPRPAYQSFSLGREEPPV